MTGEKWTWYKVASLLGKTIEELKGSITESEFLDWWAFLEAEKEEHSKLDRYLAQIAAEVRTNTTKKASKTEDFLFRYEKPLSKKEKIARSKAAWGFAVGEKAPSDRKRKSKKP